MGKSRAGPQACQVGSLDAESRPVMLRPTDEISP